MSEDHFMVLTVDPITDTIQLPRRFTQRAGSSLQNPVLLRTRDIPEWHVELDLLPNGEIWLAEGWKEFAAVLDINSGFVLFFEYESHSVFDIAIYRQSGVENPHPNNPQGSLPVNFFKSITDKGCLQQLNLSTQLNNLFVEPLPNPLFVHPEDGTKWKVNWIIVNGVIFLDRGRRETAIHLSIKEADICFFNYKGGSDISVLVCKSSKHQITTSFRRMVEGEVDMDQITLWIAKVSEYMLLKQKPLVRLCY